MFWIAEAFLFTVLSDVIFTLYLRRVGQGLPFASALLSASVLAVSGVITLFVVDHGAAAIAPVAAGGFVGTYLTMVYDTVRRK